MDDVSTANAAARVLEPRSSLDLKELSNGIPRVGDDPLSENQLERPSVEVGVETIREPEPVIPSDELSLQALAQRGDTQTILSFFQANPTLDLSSRDAQDVTPLHWAAINAHMATCRFLLDNGADVDAVGGDLKATPLQWAARNGHLYMVHLLLSRGADPNIQDAQGYNTLQLITHSSAVMPLLYMLHQPVAIDEKDTDGHTPLMWAAYQGDAISVDLLLRHGASVHTIDNAGMTPLHWAAVKGSKQCIRHLVEAGADLFIKEEQGKTARDMAEELKGLVPYSRGLNEAGYSVDGVRAIGRLSQRNTQLAIFILPTASLLCIFSTFNYLPIYTSAPLAVAEFYAMQIITMKVLLGHQPEDNRISASPYFAAIIIGSLVWVFYAWATRLITGTPGHAWGNLGFLVCGLASGYNLYCAIRADPGYVPKAENDAEVKMSLEELVDAGRLNGTNFCIMRKSLCDRSIVEHVVGVLLASIIGFRNHRYFLFFVLFLIAGILLFDHLCIAYILENAPEYTPPPFPAGLSICDFSQTLCRSGSHDAFLLSISLWATLQLTWTSILAVSHLWQVSRQMTTFEVSNLGRYGYMGGQGGQSLRDQSGAMKQAAAIGAGIGPMGASEDAIGVGANFGPDGTARGQGLDPGFKHGHGHVHGHSRGLMGMGRVCIALGRTISGPLLRILGLDRFTKGKALGGMRRAGMDQNPFDMGLVKNCMDFWVSGDVDYTRLYEIPPEGWKVYRRKLAMSTSVAGKGLYEPVMRDEV
ncbi:MAG: palmitoyltransferase akr1 [Tremellales sp. Tagirdzhanova-0007]|nr:MAG: palmitoyltransferase akr1 [Tremellales sp. Tagirdzhanova-0007]